MGNFKGGECKCGHGHPPIALIGPYAGLCAIGREEAQERMRQNRAAKKNGNQDADYGEDEITQEIRAIKRSRRQLTKSAGKIVEAAEVFEQALEDRDKAKVNVNTALGRLDDTLDEFKRIAKAKISGGPVITGRG